MERRLFCRTSRLVRLAREKPETSVPVCADARRLNSFIPLAMGSLALTRYCPGVAAECPLAATWTIALRPGIRLPLPPLTPSRCCDGAAPSTAVSGCERKMPPGLAVPNDLDGPTSIEARRPWEIGPGATVMLLGLGPTRGANDPLRVRTGGLLTELPARVCDA